MSEILAKVTSALSGDLVFIIAVLVIVFLCAMYFGKNRIASLVLAFYPATILYKSFPFIDKLIFLTGDRGVVINKIGIFLILLVIVTIVVNIYIDSYASSSVIGNGGVAFAFLILIILFSYTTVNFDVLHNFSTQIDVLFSGAGREFWWSIAPLAILTFL